MHVYMDGMGWMHGGMHACVNEDGTFVDDVQVAVGDHVIRRKDDCSQVDCQFDKELSLRAM